MTTTQVPLNDRETLFRQCLLDCRNAMPHVSGMKDLELRWTGGWVRDKLLGIDSNDIDVALSTMTGWQFGQALQEYMKEKGKVYEETANQKGIKAELGNLHKIEANPEKSKHLETITTRMFGIDVDFVNLRKEVYDEKSRNPQMEFGTPEEDALRRDACVNAMFYNLHTQQVEDFTRRGLDDLKAKILRTPLQAYQTFKDDPLRVLRLIRFAARLGYTIDQDALDAMRNPEIHEALRLKISRERVGVELVKTMTGPDPYRGLSIIYDQGLYKVVFADPDSADPQVNESLIPRVLESLRGILEHQTLLNEVLQPITDATTTWTLAAYVPYKDNEGAAMSAARGGIKSTNNVSKIVFDAVKNRRQISNLALRAHANDLTRAEVGMALRNCGKSWRSHVLYSLLCDVCESDDSASTERYIQLVEFIKQQQLEGAAELKQILNGNEIKNAMEIQKAGSWLKDVIEKVVEWQFAHPTATPVEATEWIKQNKNKLQHG